MSCDSSTKLEHRCPKTKLLRGSFEPFGSENDVKFSHARSLAWGLGQWQVAMSGEVWNHVMSCVLKALKGTHSNTSSNSIQDFRKENMTQISAQHDTTYSLKADFRPTQGHDCRDFVRAGFGQDKLPTPPKNTVKRKERNRLRVQ